MWLARTGSLVVLLLIVVGCGGSEQPEHLPVAVTMDSNEPSKQAAPSDDGGVQPTRLQKLVCWQPEKPAAGQSATMFLTREHPLYGSMNFSVSDAASASLLANNQPPNLMLEADLPAATAALNVALAIPDREQGYQALIQLRDQFPFWPMVHGALNDYAKSGGDLDLAIFHMKQLIYLDPQFANVARLGRLYGQQGRLEDSLVVLSHLYDHRDQVQDEQQAISLVGDLLVTLHRLNQGEQMVRVADEAIAEYGSNSKFEYQAILGWIMQDRNDKATERLQRVLPKIDPQDPLLPRFQQLKDSIR